MTRDFARLEDFSEADAAAFVRTAYRIILGREPTQSEDAHMRAALMRGDTRTWLLGSLRYGDEGRARGVSIPGLRPRYIAQHLFRLPILGPCIEWLNAQRRLPLGLRQIRMIEGDVALRATTLDAQQQLIDGLQRQVLELRASFHDASRVHAGERDAFHATLQNEATERDALRNALQNETSERLRAADASHALIRDLQQQLAALHGTVENVRSIMVEDAKRIAESTQRDRARVVDIERDLGSVHVGIARLQDDLRASIESSVIERQKLSALLPPPLESTFEVAGDSLVATARTKHGIGDDVYIPALPADERYALFESVFYDTDAVAAKQRIYLPYLDRELTTRWPFLDLGCGRGEFLSILRNEGIEALGVDINESNIARLHAQAFNVVKDDLVAFLERDRGTYSGAAVLQVVEHLAFNRVERMLELLHDRLAPGALLVLETPNPLSTFALSLFHTDPTHVQPLPPEALRYSVEAAGFGRTRTLYQARIPADQFAGPDRRAYYADYAIIAVRS